MPWPLKQIYGANVDPANIGPRQVSAVPTTKAASPPLQLDRYCRNGMHPDATFASAMAEATNQAMLFRGREHYSILGRSQQLISSTSGSRDRWRFAFRTEPYSTAIYAMVIMVPPNSGYDQNTHAKLTIYSDAAEVTPVASATFTYGTSPTGNATASGFPYWKNIGKMIEGLSPDTEYFAKFTDETYGRLHSATVFGLSSMSENYDGYLATSYSGETPIVSADRENIAVALRALWRRGGSKLFSWSVNDGTAPITFASSTAANVFSTSVTAVSAASPGFTLNLSGKKRVSQSGVRVVMKVFAKTSAPASGLGRVYLKDSSGATVLQITNGWPFSGAAAAWQSVTGTLPDVTAKYDLMADNGGSNTLSVYAATAWEEDV